MAAEHMFEVEVLTPEGEVFNGEVRQVSTRTAVGEIGILANHAPLLAALRPTELRLHVSDSETKRYAQAHGWLQVFGNHARLLVEEAIAPEDLDAGALKEQLADAEQRLAEAEEGSGAQAARGEGPRPGRSVPGYRQGERVGPPRRAPRCSAMDARCALEHERARSRHDDELVADSAGRAVTRRGGRRVRQGLARGARDRGRRATRCGGCRCSRPRSGPRTRRPSSCTATSTWFPALRRAVRAAGRGRPALRARRLRHEGRAGGDAGHRRGDARPGRGPGAARDRRRRGVRGGGRARQRPPGRQRLPRRLRDHRRADRPADRGRGEGRAGAAARGRGARPPTGPRPGSATTRCSRRSTFSAASSRYRLPGTARSCSTAPRSTSAGSGAATRSTRCPTDA